MCNTHTVHTKFKHVWFVMKGARSRFWIQPWYWQLITLRKAKMWYTFELKLLLLKRRKRFQICLLGNEIKIKYLYQQCLVHFFIILLYPWRHVFSVLTNYCCCKFSNNFLKLKNKNIIIKSVWLQWINIYVESASYTCIKCLDELDHLESQPLHSNS